ncbi:hypothetical protein [Staphylococcus americanisciuri]|uniref:Phage PVL protein n=1 Tax=Staphylococcus americanisciuri TaxID=2973940 RepID=A0ABT2F489_9STAP|nr:hypothetical protein [Staphylococcus americanisciuri]MCS4487207.1 hypothetical protein [Staphylococcus americanisciuri]
MAKIKVKKKRVGLDELLSKIKYEETEWKPYEGFEGTRVYPSDEDLADFEIIDFFPEDTFEIEIEQEIDEDTELKGLVEKIKNCVGDVKYVNWESPQSVNSCIKFSKSLGATSLAFYLERYDGTMHLIWKEGELVE